MPTENESLPNIMIKQMTAFIGARAIYAAAKLGLADFLIDAPIDIEKLSNLANVDDSALKRMMKILCGMGVFYMDERHNYSLTSLGETLLSDHSNSVRDYIINYHDTAFACFVNLIDCVRTGAPVFEQTFGANLYDYVGSDPEITKVFQAGMKSRTRVDTSAILAAYNFTDAGQIVDVGGGNGSLLQAIMRQYHDVSCTLFDQQSAIETAKANLEEFGDRCCTITGDFFDEVPQGAETYILKLVLHNWRDEEAVKILKNCRLAIQSNGKLLIIEGLISPPNELNFTDVGNLNMLVLFGGRERSENNFEGLLNQSGFRMNKVIPTSTNLAVIVAEPLASA